MNRRAIRSGVVVLTVLVLANLAGFFLVTLPAWRSSSAADTGVRRVQEAESLIGPQLDRARAVYGRVLDAEQRLAALRASVGSSSSSVSEALGSLRRAIDVAGLSADRIGYGVVSVAELGLLQMQVDLPVQGTYAQLRRFLDEVLSGEFFVVIERVSASTPSQAGAGDRLRLQITASVFLDTAGAEPETPPAVVESAPPRGDLMALVESQVARLRALQPPGFPADRFELRLARLDESPERSRAVRRNLFAFNVARTRTEATPEDAAPVTPIEPTEPVMPYEAIGVIRMEDGFVATLRDGAERVRLVRLGDRLPEGYRVIAIDTLGVVLEAGDRTTRLSMRKRDQE